MKYQPIRMPYELYSQDIYSNYENMVHSSMFPYQISNEKNSTPYLITEDLHKDFDYMKQMYPKETQVIQKEVEEECDKLEYDGSIMFDEYPDRVHLNFIANKIYHKVLAVNGEESDVEATQFSVFPPGPCRDCPPYRPEQPCRDCNWMRNLVDIMLFNEMIGRRSRHRRRKRWY